VRGLKSLSMFLRLLDSEFKILVRIELYFNGPNFLICSSETNRNGVYC